MANATTKSRPQKKDPPSVRGGPCLPHVQKSGFVGRTVAHEPCGYFKRCFKALLEPCRHIKQQLVALFGLGGHFKRQLEELPEPCGDFKRRLVVFPGPCGYIKRCLKAFLWLCGHFKRRLGTILGLCEGFKWRLMALFRLRGVLCFPWDSEAILCGSWRKTIPATRLVPQGLYARGL